MKSSPSTRVTAAVALSLAAALAAVPVTTSAVAAEPTAAYELDPQFRDANSTRAGSVTTPFGDLTATAETVVAQPDGKVVVVGHAEYGAWDCRGFDRGFALTRYHRYGSLDTSFGDAGRVTTPIGGAVDYPCGSGTPTTLVDARAHTASLLADGKILVSGAALTSYYDAVLARYTAAGQLDATFGTSGVVTLPAVNVPGYYPEGAGVLDTAVAADGRIVAAGLSVGSDTVTGEPRAFATLTRLLPGGGVDDSFGEAGTTLFPVDANLVSRDSLLLTDRMGVALRPDGGVVATYPTRGTLAVVAVTADGALDTGFGAGGHALIDPSTEPDPSYVSASANDLAVQPDGKIVVVGRSDYQAEESGGFRQDFAVARLTTTGAPDTTFSGDGATITGDGSGGHNDAHAVTVDDQDRIVVAGVVNAGAILWGVTRYLPTGVVDTAFTGDQSMLLTSFGATSTADVASGLALTPDDGVVLAGSAPVPSNDGLARTQFAVARFRPGTGVATKDGALIVFGRTMPDANTNMDLFTVDPVNGGETNLTQTPSSGADWNLEAHPSWSPDGSRVAYFYSGKADGSDGGLYTMTASGADKQRVLPFTETGIVYSSSWSPDGRTLVYHRLKDGRDELAAVGTDGTGHRVLTSGTAFTGLDGVGYPDHSPDGTRVAFSGSRDGVQQVFTMTASGTDVRQVTAGVRDSVDPAYSPDGSRLVFASNRDGAADCPGCHDLYTVGVDGAGEAKVLDTGDDDISPSWSPDGARLLFVRHVASGPYTVHTVDPDGTELREVTPGQEPAWQVREWPGDSDGIPDAFDNCGYFDNVTQADSDGDGAGDACDEYTDPGPDPDPEPEPEPADTTPPTVTGRSPVPGATTASPTGNVTVDFSEPLAAGSVTASRVVLKRGTTAVSAAVTLSSAGTRVTLNPSKPLAAGARYTVTVPAGGVTDVAGNAVASTASWSFSVNSAPTITPLAPAPGSTTRDRTPTIKAKVVDAQSTLSKSAIVVTVDGEVRPFKYGSGVVKLVPKLGRGEHVVKIVATDPQRMSKTKKWRFTVK